MQRVSEIINATPRGFQVLVGSAGTLYASVVLGARGGILALASALPEKCVELYELARQGQHERARELQAAVMRVSKRVVSEMGIAGVKFVMDQRGYHGGIPRLPLQPLHHEQKKRLSELLAEFETAAARA